jgi:uncharacterized protein (DUF1800 family)
MSLPACIAVNRFGLGARPGELDAARGDPRGWLEAQLAPAAVPRRLAALPGARAALDDVARLRDQLKAAKDTSEPKPAAGGRGEIVRRVVAEAGARMMEGVETAASFRERLVWFWANHFTVSAKRPVVAGLIAPFERDPIRPHVSGQFVDMVLAATRHPAMLLYLDNAQSIGPDSPAGRRRNKGLNENLARELMELHTLGADGGQTQADVTALARVLTGWTIALKENALVSLVAGPADANGFRFVARMHEPGAQTVLGRTYADDGMAQGEAVIRDLCRHPATARHVATKLARHFVADTPPPRLVEKLARTFRDTDGDLAAVTRTLVRSDEAWAEPRPKLKTPVELVVSAMRLVGWGGDDPDGERHLLSAMASLGQMPFAAPSPAGWPDNAADWAGGEALMRRVEWSAALAARYGDRLDARALLPAALGETASSELVQTVARAASGEQALALLLASPEFQRR